MHKRIISIGLALIGLLAVLLTYHTVANRRVAARPVRLVITGPIGQSFSGRYVADGITNSISAVAPVTLSLQARDVVYEFTRDGGDAEFRVALLVGDSYRTSTTSDKRQGVRGGLRSAGDRESYWAAGF